MMRAGVAAVPVVALAISDQIYTVKPVNSESMRPTLKPKDESSPRDWVLIERGWRGQGWRKDDIVLVRSPSDRKETLISRLRQLPGEMVRIPRPAGFHKLIIIPRGNCWIEGDTNVKSCDSRTLGPIPLALVEGRVTAILWPPERFAWGLSDPSNPPPSSATSQR